MAAILKLFVQDRRYKSELNSHERVKTIGYCSLPDYLFL